MLGGCFATHCIRSSRKASGTGCRELGDGNSPHALIFGDYFRRKNHISLHRGNQDKLSYPWLQLGLLNPSLLFNKEMMQK